MLGGSEHITASRLAQIFAKPGGPSDWHVLAEHLATHNGTLQEVDGATVAVSAVPPALVIHQINRHRRISDRLVEHLKSYARSQGLALLHWRSPIGNLNLVHQYLGIGAHLMGNDGSDFIWEMRVG